MERLSKTQHARARKAAADLMANRPDMAFDKPLLAAALSQTESDLAEALEHLANLDSELSDYFGEQSDDQQAAQAFLAKHKEAK